MSILISYHYINQKGLFGLAEKLADFGIPLILDSGAFSAFHSGNEIDFEKYKTFCAATEKVFPMQVALDKIGDKAQSRVNLDAMLDAGLKPVPVFTIDESEDEANIDWFLQRGKRICIAGNPSRGKVKSQTIGNARNYTDARLRYESRMETIYRQADGKVWLHGLAFTNGVNPWRTRASSVDSSSWVNSGKFGVVHVMHPTKGVVCVPWRRICRDKDARFSHPYGSYLAACGFTWKDLTTNVTTPYNVRDVLSGAAWMNFMRASLRHDVEVYTAIAALGTLAPVAAAAWTLRDDGTIDGPAAMARLEEIKAAKADDVEKHSTILAESLARVMVKPRISKWTETK